MECCNYVGSRHPYYGRYVPPQPPTYTSPYVDGYAAVNPHHDHRSLHHHHQQRAYDAYHTYGHYHHQQQIPPDYLYSGKDVRSRRILRDRERERERMRPSYHTQRWSNGLDYGDDMHHYMSECDNSWNYYQGNSWMDDRNAFMGRQYPYPNATSAAQHTQQQQPYRHDPLRGLAAMQATHTSTPMDDKMDEMGASNMAQNSCYANGNCSCGGCLPQINHHQMGDNTMRQHRSQHIQQQQQQTLKSKSKDDLLRDRPRKNRSPKALSRDDSMTSSGTLTSQSDSSPTNSTSKVESVPLPAFQQAFGSTEIGRFSGAFVRTDNNDGNVNEDADKSITEEMVRDALWNNLGDGFIQDDWREPSVVQLDACFETLPSEPTPTWNQTLAPTPAHHIY